MRFDHDKDFQSPSRPRLWFWQFGDPRQTEKVSPIGHSTSTSRLESVRWLECTFGLAQSLIYQRETDQRLSDRQGNLQ